MLWQALTAARDLGRLHEIASILIRHGFGDMVRRMGLANVLETAGRALHWSEPGELAQLETHARVRRALEEMGPTFVKLGQILATRVDLFDPEWIVEFSKLQDSTPPSPYPEIHRQLTEDLGAPPEEVFTAFDPDPLAAGSIAQVHRARLEDGSEVVVKVRRPGVRTVVEADLRWLSKLAEVLETGNSELSHFHWQEVVGQFTQSLRRELDFGAECRNAERIAANFEGYSDSAFSPQSPHQPHDHAAEALATGQSFASSIIVIPKVYWRWTSERVCVQEYINGIPGRDLAAVDRAGLDRKVLARRGVAAVIKMITIDGFFHADPHPGNVFYLSGNRIAFIDFGMVGRLTEDRRHQLILLLLGLVEQEAPRVTDVLLGWTGDDEVNEKRLTAEIQTFVDQYVGVPLKQIKLGDMLADLVGILRGHRLHLPSDLALFFKAFISLEGMGRELDPNLDIAGEALPLLGDALRAHYAPSVVTKRGLRVASDLTSLVADLPRDLSKLVRAARQGKLDLHIELAQLKYLGDQLGGAANRLVIGIVVAAIIVGSSIIMMVSGGPTLLGLPLFGLIGYLCATVGGVWLMLSISRSNKADRQKKP
ncbi:AarF/ABC1/UbiB kinase family protein [Nitrosovibrio sp. Nv6]|uniref:ABC1 kinase family protein n=1 Tax=Nitrosovibrio sp. Nv6 TaxID=1855340 RepID=UPI0008D5CF36|nr:AarF/UbiB family protein [Nitrosovibrio sp. Nv6]SEO61556.1 ubiquinone biosynthesis protein [Nitrosovibrio sp. Nv6]